MKTLTRRQAQKEAKRLVVNPALSPQTEDGVKEIIDCLMRHCEDQNHAERAITRFLDTAGDNRNLTAELTAAAKATGDVEPPPPGCLNCMVDLEDGFYYLSHIVRTSSSGIEFAGRCTCPRGRWLASRDLWRAKEQAASCNAVVTTEMQERVE